MDQSGGQRSGAEGASPETVREDTVEAVRRDLLRLKLDPALMEPILLRLARIYERLRPEAYRAVLFGLALGCTAQRREHQELRASLDRVAKLESSLSSFGAAVMKLESSLRTLTTRLTRGPQLTKSHTTVH